MTNSYPQSGAGHHLASGSDTRIRRSMNSSYLLISEVLSSICAMSFGWNLSAHSGHAIFTRLSIISIFKYWRRHSRQDLKCTKINSVFAVDNLIKGNG